MAESEAVPGAKPVSKKRRRLWLKVGLPLIVVVVVGCAIWVWATLGFVYASTQRTGYVRNLSQRGWLCKTWEGELTPSPAAAIADTTTAAIFRFTIRNDSVAKALQLAAGHQVTLSYDEHRGIPTTCFGETQDFVQGFRVDQ
jgi:hypothetical protein